MENKNSKISSDVCDFFINWAKELLGKEITVTKEPHGDEGAVFKIESEKGNYFLKIKIDSKFSKERERLAWFEDKIPVPRVVGFTEKDGTGAILLTALDGRNLAVICKEWPVEKVITKFTDALRMFHNIDTTGWPFEKLDSGKILVHGDACLPNFIFHGDQFSGYIDLSGARISNPEVDLSAAVWSLQYNLGPGHGILFLEKYGYDNATEETVNNLRLEYEDYQRKHGFL